MIGLRILLLTAVVLGPCVAAAADERTDAPSQNVPSQNAPSQNPLSQEVASQNVLSQNTSSQRASSEDESSQAAPTLPADGPGPTQAPEAAPSERPPASQPALVKPAPSVTPSEKIRADSIVSFPVDI